MSRKECHGLKETIEKAMKELKVHGAQVAIVKDGDIIFNEAFGWADVEKKTKMTKEHLLPIGSSTKAFTAAAVVALAADGKVDLDTPVCTYLPEFQMSDPIASKEATPRDLLCHRTGMPRHDLMWINWYELEREDVVRRLRYLEASAPFRSIWQYQNHMYATAGYLVDRLSGMSYEEFMAQRFLEPLGMKHFSFAVEDTEQYARLYTEDENGDVKLTEPLSFHAMGPAGSINSTAEEMIQWVRFHLNQGKVAEEQLIPEELFAELHKPCIPYQILPFEFEEEMRIGYALGWCVDSYRGKRVIHHGGNVNGATSLVTFMPDMNLGLVALVNADHSMLPSALAYEVFDRFLGCEGEKDWFVTYDTQMRKLMKEMQQEKAGILDKKVEGTTPAHSLQEYVGRYEHPGYGVMTVQEKDGGLVLQHNHYDLPLEHLHYETFTFTFLELTFTAQFLTNVEGEVEQLLVPWQDGVKSICFQKEKED
jgi:CubicO group peptidase (beta-lactamase class C family)